MTRHNEFGQPIGEPVSGWSPRSRPSAVQLTGRWTGLEPVSVAHAEGLSAALAAPEDEPLWTYRPAERPGSLARLTEQLVRAAEDPVTVTWSVVPHGAGPAGLLSLMRADPAHGVVELGSIIFGRSLQRTRVATEALILVIRHVFDDLGYRRLEWKCDSLNEPSRAAAVRLGFRYEGRFRNAVVYKGRNRDSDWFAIADDDWPALAAAYDAWLAEDNFDDTGAQRQRLSVLTAS